MQVELARAAPRPPSLRDGLMSLPRAAGVIRRSPRLRTLTLWWVFGLAGAVAGVLLFWAGFELAPSHRRWGAALEVAGFLLFLAFLPVSGPISFFVEAALAEEAAAELGVPRRAPPEPWSDRVRAMGASFGVHLAGLLVCLTVARTLPWARELPVPQVIAAVVWSSVGALWYPARLSGHGLRGAATWIARHPGTAGGYVLASVLLALVPVLDVVLRPLAVVAATRAYLTPRGDG